MVSLVIALLVSIAATGAAIFFDASQRQGVGTSVATVGVSNALAAMKEDASQAGLGFLGASSFKCTELNYSVGDFIVASSTFSPLVVTRDGQGLDQLDVAYGTHVALSQAPGSSNTACTVQSVSSLNRATFASPATDIEEDQGFVWHRYRVAGSDLVVDRLDGQSPPVAVVRNVVAFRVQYGVAAAPASPTAPRNTTVIDWTDATGSWSTLTPGTIGQVRALRVGIVTRSANAEKADAAGSCSASSNIPTPLGGLVALSPRDPRACFRYRLDTAVIPLRNVNLSLGI